MATGHRAQLVKDREQADRRRGAVWVDQHGRTWDGEIDVESFAPVGPLHLKNYRQPIPTPLKYVKPKPGSVTELAIDYAQWRRDLAEGERTWQGRLYDVAKRMFPNSMGEVMANPPAVLLAEVGPGPLPREFVEAMASGNKWALGIRRADGLPYPVPQWVTPDLHARWQASRPSVTWSAEDDAALDRLDATKYADEDDEAATPTAGLDWDPKYADLEEAEDPDAVGGRTVRGRTRMARAEE